GGALLQGDRLAGKLLGLLDHPSLDGGIGKGSGRAGSSAALDGVGADVIAVAGTAVLAGIGRSHVPATGPAIEEAFQKRGGTVALATRTASSAEQALYLVPELGINDCLVFTWVDFPLVLDLADVDDVGQQVMEAGLGKWLAD